MNRWIVGFNQILLLVLLAPNCIAQERPSQSADSLLMAARTSIADNELERAESELRQLLGIVLEQLGAAYSSLSEEDLALRAFREASQASIINDRPLLALTRFCIQTRHFEEGKEAVEKLLAINPIHSGGRHLLGKIMILTGDLEPASHVLKDAYLAAPENQEIGFTLAYSYLKRGDLVNGVPIIEELYSKNSQSPSFAFRIGRAFLETGHISQAETYLKVAVDAGLAEAQIYLDRGSIGPNPSTGDSPSVLFDEPKPVIRPEASVIASLRRTAAFAYGKLGELEMRNQRFPWAEDHISRAVFWDEELPGILVLLGWARFRGGDLLTAIGPVKKALSKQPQDLEAQQLLTRITIELVDDKQLEKAGECADLLIALEPDTAFFFVLRGRLYGEKGDSQSALADFSRALQLDPNTPEAHYNSGILMLRTQGPEAALREFDQELQISPDHDMAMFGKAEVLNQLGRRQEAIQLLQKVLILNPGSIPAYRLIARLQISEGNLTGATANLETASRMDPENAEIQLELSTIYAQAGRDADAAAAKARYEELKKQ